MKQNQLFFINDKDKITISYNKQNFNRQNTRDDIREYLVMAYLRFNCTVSGKVCATLTTIAAECGYPSKNNAKDNNDKIRETLCKFSQNGLFTCNKDLHTIRNTEYFELQLTDEYNIFYCDSNFVSLSMAEFETIIHNETRAKKDILFATYLCLKKYTYSNPDIKLPNLIVTTQDAIKRVVGVTSRNTIADALNDLVKLKLIYTNNLTYFYYDEIKNKFYPTASVYALDKAELYYAKEVLQEKYNVDAIYTSVEIASKEKERDKYARRI